MESHKTSNSENSNEETTIADSLYSLCKSMTFPLLMSFNDLINLDLEELVDIVEVFANEQNGQEGGARTVYENGEKIIEYRGVRR